MACIDMALRRNFFYCDRDRDVSRIELLTPTSMGTIHFHKDKPLSRAFVKETGEGAGLAERKQETALPGWPRELFMNSKDG
jgi:hypothetical protein